MKRAVATLLIATLVLATSACMSGAAPDDQAPPPEEPAEIDQPPAEEPPAEEPEAADEPAVPPDDQPDVPPAEEPAEAPPADDEPESSEPEPAEDDSPGAEPGAETVIDLEEMEVPPGMQLVCNDSGCFYTPVSIEDLELADPDHDYWFLPEDADPDSYTRIICLVGDTCYFARVTMEDMQLAFPEGSFFTAYSDADLAGSWTIVNHPATVNCTGLGAIDLPETVNSGVIERYGEDVIGTGLAEDSPDITFNRLGYGTYMAYFEVSTTEGPVVFTYYLALQDDDTFFGFLNSDYSAAGSECHVTRTFTATRS